MKTQRFRIKRKDGKYYDGSSYNWGDKGKEYTDVADVKYQIGNFETHCDVSRMYTSYLCVLDGHLYTAIREGNKTYLHIDGIKCSEITDHIIQKWDYTIEITEYEVLNTMIATPEFFLKGR